MLNNCPRYPLLQGKTSLHPLPRLSALLGGPNLFIKRDDLTGLAFGGNKTRKLEFLLGAALAEGADTLLTAGAAQSNHCRQTAAAAAQAGLSCHLALGGAPPAHPNGNLLLDDLLGAQLHWTGTHRKGEQLEKIARQLQEQGRNPYLIPYGGSSPVGACGYVAAMQEVMEQQQAYHLDIDHMLLASSSAGTQAGLTLGAQMSGFKGGIQGIAIDKGEPGEPPLTELLPELANVTAIHLGRNERFSAKDFALNHDYLGEGYGVVGPAEREAIRLVARTEGIVLDPVYTGRAMAGLIDLIRQGFYRATDTVLFWHTGGGPAVFAYAEDLHEALD